MPIEATRALLGAVLSGELGGVEFRTDPVFGFEVPVHAPGVDEALLDPRSTWADPEAYDRKARELAQMFADNFADEARGRAGRGRRGRSEALAVSAALSACGPRGFGSFHLRMLLLAEHASCRIAIARSSRWSLRQLCRRSCGSSPGLDRGEHGALRLVHVRAVGEAAVRGELLDVRERRVEAGGAGVPELQLAQARRVDHEPAARQHEQLADASSCGGPRRRPRASRASPSLLAEPAVHERRLADAGRAEQDGRRRRRRSARAARRSPRRSRPRRRAPGRRARPPRPRRPAATGRRAGRPSSARSPGRRRSPRS